MSPSFPPSLSGLRIHLVGAKGTGMAALAELLAAAGARLSGSDVPDRFYTDAILASIGVEVLSGFEAPRVEGKDLVIYSAAYSAERNPELAAAISSGVPLMSYPEALGAYSAMFDSSGIAGVHGKTTTTAMCGALLEALALPATVLVGSAVSSFGGRCTLRLGERFFVAETCEYRRHFLNFKPRRIVLTSVDHDHQDYFPAYADILSAFVEYGRLLPPGGELIYCSDDRGAVEAAGAILAERPDIAATPYGERAEGPFRIASIEQGEGVSRFALAGFDRAFELRVPGRHLVLDAAAALALAFSILGAARAGSGPGPAGRGCAPAAGELDAAAGALARFSGSKRRSEILGEARGVLFMDDYGHHPTAIRETILGIKSFWPSRRLVVDFMPHLYSRTKALFDEFAACLDEADAVVMHEVYASAREIPDGTVTGRSLYEAARARREARGAGPTWYYGEPMAAADFLQGELRPGDLFLTMGAGDNWKLGECLLGRLAGGTEAT